MDQETLDAVMQLEALAIQQDARYESLKLTIRSIATELNLDAESLVERIDTQAEAILQRSLEKAEDQDPHIAALLQRFLRGGASPDDGLSS